MGIGRTAAAAAQAASRCISRCELLRAASPCHRAGLVRRAKALGSTSLLDAGCGRAGWLESSGGDCINLTFIAAFVAAGLGSMA